MRAIKSWWACKNTGQVLLIELRNLFRKKYGMFTHLANNDPSIKWRRAVRVVLEFRA
jgi:hypothetical protein